MSANETVRKETQDSVVGRPFTRVPGQPTWEQKQKFLEEAEEWAMEYMVNYDWAGDHGLLAEIMGRDKYYAKTGKWYTPPVRPPVVHPDVSAGILTDKQARIATLNHNQLKLDYAVLEGFRTGFGIIYRNAFDKKYFEQLYEETFKYKRILPRQFIAHLESRWVKQDTMVIKRLRALYFRGWEEEEHLTSYRTRLLREKTLYATYDPPVIITDAELQQHYLEEVLKRSDIFGEKCLTKWNAKTAARQAWPRPYRYFEKRMKEVEDYEAVAGKNNSYATANAATDLQHNLEETMAAVLTKTNAEHAMALNEIKEGMAEQIHQLTQAMALLVKSADKENRTPRASNKRSRRDRYESSSEEEESSDEEEPSPPPKRKKKKKKTKRATKPSSSSSSSSYDENKPYRPGMKWDGDWRPLKKAAFTFARKEFQSTGTKEAIKDKITGMKAAMKAAKDRDDDDTAGRYKVAIAKFEKKLEE